MAAVFAAIVPVQRFDAAKTRLRVPRPTAYADVGAPVAAAIDALARAMAADTLDVVTSTPMVGPVVVVSDDAGAWELAEEWGAEWCPDPRDGLNAAVMAGAEMLSRIPIGGSTPLRAVVVPTDLVGLTPDVLQATLESVGSRVRWFIADHGGTGTALLGLDLPATSPPCFGEGSAREHTRAGFQQVDLPSWLEVARRDIDTWADLGYAMSGAWAMSGGLALPGGVAKPGPRVRQLLSRGRREW